LNLLDFVSQNFFAEFAESLEGSFLLLEFLLLVLSVVEFKTFFGTVFKLVSIKVLELLDDVLVNGVNHVDDLEISLSQGLDEGGGSSGSAGLTGDDEDVLLSLFHAGDVILETDQLLARLRCVVSQEFRKFLSIAGIFVNTEFKVLAELFVELLEIFSIFADFSEEFDTFLGNVLLDDLKDLVVLKILSADIKREIL
jgi:hypothetical protein